MNKAQIVPDAWDDDWENQADQSNLLADPAPVSQSSPKKTNTRASKAQRRAQQAEFNRQIWAEAEGTRETFHFLETKTGANVPLKSEFKPAPVLLSRKGPPKSQSPVPPANGLSGLSLAGDDDEASEDDGGKKSPTLEERQIKAAREREEKQRRYEERREQLFGPAKSTSGISTPRDATPPGSRSGTPARGRGSRQRNGGSRPSSATVNVTQDLNKELYDPDTSSKAEITLSRRKELDLDRNDKAIRPSRSPRGPDSTGFGFASRDGKVP